MEVRSDDSAAPGKPPGVEVSTTKAAAVPAAQAWSISFASSSSSRRKITKKEKAAMNGGQIRNSQKKVDGGDDDDSSSPATPVPEGGLNQVDALPVDRSVAVPTNLSTTASDLLARTHFDMQRFVCVAKQYPRSCGITSLVSVWNYLYSVAGASGGTLPVVSQEEIMTILGFEPPFDAIRWGPFTGNVTLMRWFHAINARFKVRGKAHYLYKAHGLGRTIGLGGDDAKELVKSTLQNSSAAIIYHCHNHYMVPIGFQDVPHAQIDFYKPKVASDQCDTTLFIGEVSRGKHTSLHAKKWRDIDTDINTQFPNFFNIRQSEKGVQTREKCKRVGGNLHCLLCFRKDVVEEDVDQFLAGQEEEDDDGQEIENDVAEQQAQPDE